jgi:hypothetical protein
MSGSTFSLSAKGLSRIPELACRNDFEFIVGDRHYACPSYVADFLSPLICRLHASDPSVDQFCITPRDEYGDFDHVLSLARGQPLVVTDRNCAFLCALRLELEYEELSDEASRYLEANITRENVFERLQDAKLHNLSTARLIEFLASHFHEFHGRFFESNRHCLSYDDFDQILRQSALKLRNEDGVVRMIASLLKDDPSFFGLFEYVQFQYLSTDFVSRFSELAVEHFDRFTVSLWARIAPRLARAKPRAKAPTASLSCPYWMTSPGSTSS